MALKVCLTGAAGQIAYSLVFSIAKGDVFGKDQEIILTLLDIEPQLPVLNGVVMELQDCAFPLLKEVIPTADPNVAFDGIDAAFFVGAFPRKDGMLRKDLLTKNMGIFKGQGKALNDHAKKTVKALVVGNPANTNCLILKTNAPDIPEKNFSCLTRLDQNRAKAQIAARVGVSPAQVRNISIWGNHSATQYPDIRHATVTIDGKVIPVKEAVKDDSWLDGDFITTVQKRGAAIIKARKLSSAASAANAACDHMRNWWFGTPEGEWVSMGIVTDGTNYDIPAGLVYSMPVKIKNRDWEVVKGLTIDQFSRERMDRTKQELLEERETALGSA